MKRICVCFLALLFVLSCFSCGRVDKSDEISTTSYSNSTSSKSSDENWFENENVSEETSEPTSLDTSDNTSEVTHGEYEDISQNEVSSATESSQNEENISFEADEDSFDRTHGEYESSSESSLPIESEPEVHTCSFIADKKTEPSCTAQGYTLYKCACGRSEKREFVNALGHDEGVWKVIREATTTATGLKRLSCGRCGATISEETIDKIIVSHTCSLSKINTVSATCTTQGYTLYKCSCGKTEKRDYVKALGHTAGDWVVVTEATADTEGLKKKYCVRCDIELERASIAVLDKSQVNENDPNFGTLLEERILHYINAFRVAEGKSEMTMLTGKSRAFARGRSEQLVTNFSHDTVAGRKLATELGYGYYVEEQPETIYDWETDTIISTGNTIPAYYEPYGGEAITGGYSSYGLGIDFLAENIASTIYNSAAHWAYIGSDSAPYIAIGVSYGDVIASCGPGWYICLISMGTTEFD